MKTEWRHIATCVEGQPVLVDGVDVWKHKWRQTGADAEIEDPIHGQGFVFHIYALTAGHRQVEFAAGEFSNGVWGIFRRETV